MAVKRRVVCCVYFLKGKFTLREKNITERTLEEYNDVFADILNVLLFRGEQVVLENDLFDTGARSQ